MGLPASIRRFGVCDARLIQAGLLFNLLAKRDYGAEDGINLFVFPDLNGYLFARKQIEVVRRDSSHPPVPSSYSMECAIHVWPQET
jgi:hypothetical protein